MTVVRTSYLWLPCKGVVCVSCSKWGMGLRFPVFFLLTHQLDAVVRKDSFVPSNQRESNEPFSGRVDLCQLKESLMLQP